MAQLTDISNDNGFHLVKLGKTQIKTSEQLIYFNYNITPIYNEFIKIKSMKESIISQTKDQNTFEDYINILTYNFVDLENQINKIFHKISKRGLINGIGSIIKSISGNLDATDGERYDKLIEEIQNNEKLLQDQTNQNLKISKEMIEKFNKQIENIKSNEIKLKTEIEDIQKYLKKNSYWQGKIDVENKIQKLIFIIQNLDDLTKQIEISLTFCNLRKLHTSIIDPNNIKRITQNKDIWQLNEIIETYCQNDNEQIHFLINIPIFSSQSYDLYQFTPLPFIRNNNILQINEKQTMYFVNNNDNFKVNKCIVINKIYYCKTEFIGLNKCLVSNLKTQKNDDCKYHILDLENTWEKIQNTNELIIISPKEQQIQINCESNTLNKKIKGIFKLKLVKNCVINNFKFDIIQESYKEIFFESVNFNNTFEPFNSINLDKINKVNITLKDLPQIEYNWQDNDHHFYIIYVTLFLIICFIVLCKFRVKISTLCKNRKKSNKNKDNKESPIELSSIQ